MTPWNAETYAKASALASRCHHGQTYGGTVEGERIEYINHIASVAVAGGALALTKDENIADKTEKIADSLHRIKLQPRESWMVKLADRVTNLPSAVLLGQSEEPVLS